MTCKEFDALLDSIRDGSLTLERRAAIDAHLASCDACRFKYQVLIDSQSLDETEPVPDSLFSSWRQGIKEEEEHQVKQFPRLARWLAVAAALVVLVGGTWMAGRDRRETGVSVPQASYGNQAFGGRAAPESDLAMAAQMADAPADANRLSKGVGGESETKIIRTVRIELSTRQFNADYDALLATLTRLGGRVQNTSLYNAQGNLRVLYLNLRVPVDKLDQAIASFKGVGRLVSFNESAEDVSEQYTDTAARLKTQQTKMERLQALLTRAESVEDLVTIEGSITDTQYMIDTLTGQLQGLDSRVKDATLDLTLNELGPLETARDQEETLVQRIAGGMRAAFQQFVLILGDMLVFLAVALPYLLVLAVIIAIIYLILRRKHQ